ncbi:hypothetical protein I4U23_006030 [Adineta vaga]|nr:hypothetical protein I4U23_006030 [Adineta vaga]
MRLLFLLFFCVISITGNGDDILQQLHDELSLSKTTEQDHIINFLCETLASPGFLTASADDDFLSTILEEVGFGALGVIRNSWAAKYQAQKTKSSSCFAALHAVGTSDKLRMSLAHSRKIIRACCLPNEDL